MLHALALDFVVGSTDCDAAAAVLEKITNPSISPSNAHSQVVLSHFSSI